MSETPNYPIPYLVLEEWYFPDGTDYPERFSIRLREWDTLGAEEKGFHDEERAEACIRSPHHLQQTEGFYKEKDDRASNSSNPGKNPGERGCCLHRACFEPRCRYGLLSRPEDNER